MNKTKDSTCVLQNLWRNAKYLSLLFIYILIAIFTEPKLNIIVNEITYKTVDSYTTVITQEDKIKVILEKYDLTKDQFNVLCAIVLSEAEGSSYEDAYAVINTIYNRTHSKNWVKSVSNYFGEGKGNNLYYQAISPNQFVVYEHGTYKKNLNNTKSIGYEAIIDFLYTENIIHNYLSFRSHNIKVKDSVAFSENGNNYFNPIKESNRV